MSRQPFQLYRWMLAIVVFPVCLVCAGTARGGDIREMTSPSGIKIWLAEDHASPLLSLRFAFVGGSTVEPKGKDGASRVLARMLLEGADGIDAATFRKRSQRAGLRLTFQAGRDAMFGSLDLPIASIGEAASLLRAALLRPHVEPAALDKVKAQIIADIEEDASDPRAVANDAWYRVAFANEEYSRRPDGARETISALQTDDLMALHVKVIVRSGLYVAAVGAIEPAALVMLVDRIFAALPAGDAFASAHVEANSAAPNSRLIKDVAGAAIVFGFLAPPPNHPDHAAARIIAHLLGSGDLDSRLIEDLRIKRALAYSAYSSILADRHASVLLGTVATSNANADTAAAVLQSTIEKFAEDGPNSEGLETAKSVLVGADLLSLDSSAQLADAMLNALLNGEPLDFVERRKRASKAVTLEQARRIARRLLASNRMVTVIVSNASQ